MTAPRPETDPQPETAPRPETGFDFVVPVAFHDLGLHLTDEERAAHLEEISAEIWCGGTDHQRRSTQELYGGIADAAAADGATYAGICMVATEDDRVSSASLIIRSETVEPADAETIARTLQDVLTLDPAADVHRTEVEAGPAVVSFVGVEWTPPGGAAAIPMAKVDVYLPLPEASSLLVMSLTTPSLPELPDYVALLSELAGTVRLLGDDTPVRLPAQQDGESAARIASAFG
ncbi:hypothetical protein [Kitasatospora terrestris]|uniref:Uncharacterized protein n=1 Tax=Kitasatospora terrestris TaxID=258051 RepID=A0ABP9E332_9ACTN